MTESPNNTNNSSKMGTDMPLDKGIDQTDEGDRGRDEEVSDRNTLFGQTFRKELEEDDQIAQERMSYLLKELKEQEH